MADCLFRVLAKAMISFDYGGGGTQSALNDTEDLAGKPGTGQTRRLGAWWKKLV